MNILEFLQFSNAFWINVDYKELESTDIDDQYLINICYFVAKGLGHQAFIYLKDRINRIYEEAYKRKILRPDIILLLHSWALYHHGYLENEPRYFPSETGEYLKLNDTF